MAISAHLFISLALSGFKTLFKSCPEQVPKCYKLFPSLCAFNVSTSDYFRDFMKFCPKITDGFKEFPENIGRLKLEIFMRKVVGQVCRLRGRSPQWESGSKSPPRSPQWDPPHIHSKSEDLDPNYPAKKFELSANFSKYATKWPKNGPKWPKYDPKWPKYDPKWPNMALD